MISNAILSAPVFIPSITTGKERYLDEMRLKGCHGDLCNTCTCTLYLCIFINRDLVYLLITYSMIIAVVF